MGDLSENFSKLEIMCPCSCGADKISSVLIEKLKKVNKPYKIRREGSFVSGFK